MGEHSHPGYLGFSTRFGGRLRARVGEPFRLFFAPEELEAELRGLGFTAIDDLDGAAIRTRWFGESAQENRLHGRSGRLLCAGL